ncbi:MAG: PIN domain-containing protein [Chloroflexi bacterium]|nr:PIN domain-containing protein [Chloroflexota bacterium]
MAESLVDTNVLVYVEDPRDTAKQAQARDVLGALLEAGEAVVSVQCLSEFFSVATRRLHEPLTVGEASARLRQYIRLCRTLDVTRGVLMEACEGVARHQLQWWDALIWAAARVNGIGLILTEDQDDGRVIEGVRYRNPFARV